MTVLRLESLSARGVDHALASAGPLLLWREADGVFAEVAPDAEVRLARSLAYAGVRATPVAILPPSPPALTAAIGLSLAHVPVPSGVDLVRVRPLDLGEATGRLLQRRFRRRARRRERDRCVEILKGRDRMIGWQRRAWAPVAIFRDRRVRGVLRPLLFDRAAVPPERMVFAADGEIARWAFS